MTERTPVQIAAHISARMQSLLRWLDQLGTPDGAEAICHLLDGVIADAQDLRGLADVFRTADQATAEADAFDQVMSLLDSEDGDRRATR